MNTSYDILASSDWLVHISDKKKLMIKPIGDNVYETLRQINCTEHFTLLQKSTMKGCLDVP